MTNVVNFGALLLALALSLVAVARTGGAGGRADGMKEVGADFARIVSLGITTDAALAELCEPGRVVGVSAWTTGPLVRRWQGVPRLRGLDDLEAIIALAPDLVLVNTAGGEGDRLARLRAAGLRVEALGPMSGLDGYARDLAAVGDLLGRGDEGRAIATRLRDRLARVADPAAPRPRALYLATWDGTLFGGTVGTSYHDVLIAAGCRDAAEGAFTGWPQFSAEQVLTLAPELVVTKVGMGERIAAISRAPVVELPGELLEDPGPRLLEAAELLRDRLAERRRQEPAPAGPGTATSR